MKTFSSVLRDVFNISEAEKAQNFYIIIGLYLLLAAISLSENVKGLQRSAFYGFVAIIYMIFLVFINGLFQANEDIRIDSAYFDVNYNQIIGTNNEITDKLAIIILSFSFHSYIFPIYECLNKPTTKKMMISCSLGILISTVAYIVIGAGLYIGFGSHVYDRTEIYEVIKFNKIGFGIVFFYCVSVVMSFPISFFSVKSYTLYVLPILRDLITKLICKHKVEHIEEDEKNTLNKSNHHDNLHINTIIKDEETKVEHIEEENKHHSEPLSKVSQYIVAFLLYTGVFTLCYYVYSLKYIFSFLGSIVANLNSFIFPSLFYIKFSNNKLQSTKHIIPFLFILSGFAFMIICNFYTFSQMTHTH